MNVNEVIEGICNQFEQDEYAMYLRKSRADLEMEALGEGETLARHKHILDALASKHEIHPGQITVYKEVVSGESIDDRPEMQRLLSDVYQRKYKGVLVVEVERLARGNTKDQGEVAEAFQASDTKIITPAKVYDPHNEFDQEYFEFGLFMSRREYKTIKRRLQAGIKQSFEEGNYIPSQPVFGYTAERLSKKDRILVEKPEESRIVKLMFDWFLDGWSTWKIANELTAMNVPTVKGKKDWNRGTVRDMLANVHYIGKVVRNKETSTRKFDPELGKMVKVRKRNPKEEWIILEGKHKGIIDEDKFARVQEMLKIKNPVKHDFHLVCPIAGLLRCKDCGRAITIMRYNDGSRTNRFTHGGNSSCYKKSMPENLVMEALIDSLKSYINDFEILMNNGNDQEKLKQHKAMIAAMEAELEKREAKRKKLFDSYEDGAYSRDEFIERKQLHTQAIEEIKKQLKNAKESIPEPMDYSEQITNLHKLIDCIGDDNMDIESKNIFLKQFISRIDYDAIDYGRNKGGKVVLDVYLK